jgi:hypothetical protein
MLTGRTAPVQAGIELHGGQRLFDAPGPQKAVCQWQTARDVGGSRKAEAKGRSTDMTIIRGPCLPRRRGTRPPPEGQARAD